MYVKSLKSLGLTVELSLVLPICVTHLICALCRYLYTLDFPESRISNQPDQTLEILMSELDPVVMDQFYMKDGVTANDVTRVRLLENKGFFGEWWKQGNKMLPSLTF